MRARVARFTAFSQALLLMATLVVPALAAATEIFTDLWVYGDGDTVNVTGVDFGANEVVQFVTTDPDGTVVNTGSSSSDGDGGVRYSFVLTVTVGGIYDIVATGESSGLTAATQFDPISTTTTQNLSASSITYGQSVTASGSLTRQDTGLGFSGTINLTRFNNSGCSGGSASAGSTTSSAAGAWGPVGVQPTSIGTFGIEARFPGSGFGVNALTSSSNCDSLSVARASTTTTGSVSAASIFNTQSFTVSYATSASVGIIGNTATGTISVVKDTGPAGSLGCTPALVPLSQPQTAGGFSQSGTNAFTCTPPGPGTWTMHVQFSDSDGNYNNSGSSTLTVVVEPQHSSVLSEVLTPSTIYYGQSTTITGSLDDTTAGVPIVNVSVENDRQSGNDCGGSTTLIGSDLTDSNGDYSVTYRPTQTESKDIKAFYAGDAAHASASACATLTVERAPSDIVGAALSDTSISVLESTFVDYKVQSAFGVLGNNANGTLSIVKDSGAGTLTCTASTTAVNRPEANADGTGADDAGFGLAVDASNNTAYRFSCSASDDDTYTFHVHFTGDADFDASDSDTLTLVVSSNTPPTVDAGGDYSGTEGAAINLDATVNDIDGDVLTYKWTIAYNSNMDASGACVFGNDSTVDTTLTCNDDSNAGTFTVTLTVNGDPDGTVADSAEVTVSNVKPTVTLSGGNALSVTESTTAVEYAYTADDVGDNDALTKTISCGAKGTAVANSDDGDSFQCQFLDGGGPTTPATSSDVTITVTDDEGAASTQAKQTVSIANANPVVAAPSLSTTTICQGSQATLTGISFSDAGTLDTPWPYLVTWGDGTTSGGSFTTQGVQSSGITATFNTPGTFTPTLKVTDKDGGFGTATSSNSITVVAHYRITFLQPVDGTTDGSVSNAVKLGRVVPIKILVWDNCANNFNGAYVTDPTTLVRLHAALAPAAGGTLLDSVELYADAGQANNNSLYFRWTADASAPGGGFWIYNLDTKNSSQPKFELNQTYRIDASIGGVIGSGTASQYALLKMAK